MIGDLKHRITFQILVADINENGFEVSEWQDYKTVWAKVLNLSGKEYFEAATINKEKTVKFIIRFIKEIDGSMMINKVKELLIECGFKILNEEDLYESDTEIYHKGI